MVRCPWLCVSSSSTLRIFWGGHLWWSLCLPVCLLNHFPWLRHVLGSTPTGVFEGGCWPLMHSSLGFPFHFFVASSLNLWGWWHVWSDCHLLRQSSGEHGCMTSSTSLLKLTLSQSQFCPVHQAKNLMCHYEIRSLGSSPKRRLRMS